MEFTNDTLLADGSSGGGGRKGAKRGAKKGGRKAAKKGGRKKR
jgi:hypothetical protein